MNILRRPERATLSALNLTRRGVPKQHHFLELSDLHDFGNEGRRQVIEYVQNYCTNLDEAFYYNKGIMLYGSNGVGKTTIASLIVKTAYKKRYTSMRCTYVDYMREYTRIWDIKDINAKEEAQDLFYHNYKGVEFLVLEEVGKEVDSKLSPVILEDLLRFREDQGLPTIICSNLLPSEIMNKYGASVGSLLKGNFTPLELVGVDKRPNSYRERGE